MEKNIILIARVTLRKIYGRMLDTMRERVLSGEKNSFSKKRLHATTIVISVQSFSKTIFLGNIN